MSVDKSLRSKNTLQRHRNVLNRAERIAKLQELERWPDDGSAFGLPKVAHRKAAIGKKVKKKGEEEGAEAAPAAKAGK